MHQNLTYKKISAVGFLMTIIFSVILSWKLLRLIVPIQYFWNMHNYLIILFAILSLVVGLRYSFYLQKSRTSMAVLIFIGLSLVRLGYFQSIDSFTMCSLVFCSYFLMLRILMQIGKDTGFKYFESLIILLLIYNAFDYFDANNDSINVISYVIPAFAEGTLGSLGNANQPIWASSMTDGVIIRSIGVAGTHYASSALVAATAVYFFILKRRFLFLFSIVLVVFWGVGSSLASAIIVIVLSKIRSIWSMFYIIVTCCLVLLMFQNRGFDPDHVFSVKNNFIAFDFLFAAFFGEGKSISSMHSEFRMFGLILSLGIIGSFLSFCMIYNYYSFTKYDKVYGIDSRFKAAFFFLLVLIVSTTHYNTLFVFPNVFFVVALFALSSMGFIEMRDDAQKDK